MESLPASSDLAQVLATVQPKTPEFFTLPNRAAKRKFRRALRAMRRRAARQFNERHRPTGLPVKAIVDEIDAHVQS